MPSRAITGDVKAGQRLRLIRKHLKLKQDAFAKLIGVKQSMVSMMESGQSDIPLFVIQTLCVKYEISTKYIILGVGDMVDTEPKEMGISDESKQRILIDGINIMKTDIAIALDEITYLREKLNLIEINKLNK